MAAYSKEWYRQRAAELLRPAGVMIDMAECAVSIGLEQNVNKQGAWVQLWAWVPDPENTHVQQPAVEPAVSCPDVRSDQ